MSKAIGKTFGAGVPSSSVYQMENNILNYLNQFNQPQISNNDLLLQGMQIQNPAIFQPYQQQMQFNLLQQQTADNPALQQQYKNLLLQSLQNQIRATQQTNPWVSVQNSLSNDIDSVMYGVSRALNGITYGGFDYLGNKLGIDTQMNNYLQNQAAAGMGNIVQTVGNMAELGGNILPWLVGGAVVSGPINAAYNGYKIGKAYDRLQQNPYQGQGSDVIARMRNHAGEPVVLQRGEAIPDNMGNTIVQGRDLKRATGTYRNYGLDKGIYKHGISREDAQKIPKIINNNPAETNSYGQNIYLVRSKNGVLRVVTSPQNGDNIIASMYYLDIYFFAYSFISLGKFMSNNLLSSLISIVLM